MSVVVRPIYKLPAGRSIVRWRNYAFGIYVNGVLVLVTQHYPTWLKEK